MGAFKRGCLEFIVVWGLVGFLEHSLFKGKFEPPGDFWGAIIGGFFVACAWGSLRNAFLSLARRKLLASSRLARPKDGKVFAVSGIIRPMGEPLRSPFLKRECISYGYEVSVERVVVSGSGSDKSTQRQKNVIMGGFAMCPSIVRSEGTEIRILGFPFPHEFPQEHMKASQLPEVTREYLTSTNFEVSRGLSGLKSMWTQIQSVLSDDDGSHRHDWRTENAEEKLSDPSAIIMEQYIPPGSQVCVIGQYSQSKGGLLNDFSTGGLEVLSGGLESGLRTYRNRIITGVIGTILCALLGTAGVYGGLSFREKRERSVQAKHVERLIKAISSENLSEAKQSLERGVSLEHPDGNLRDAITNCRSVAMLKLLIESGLPVNQTLSYGYTLLLRAVRDGNVERVNFLLDLGADPNVLQAGWGNSPLDLAFDSGNKEIFMLLSAKNARGTFVTTRSGKPLPKEGSAEMNALKLYLEAFEGNDTAKVRALSDSWPEDFFESFERGLYRRDQKCGPQLEAGYANDEVATLLIQCHSLPARERWMYTLVKRSDGWKIRRSHWDEGFSARIEIVS